VNVIFDLDGTLVDSYEDIAACLESAFQRVGVTPEKTLVRSLIGPSLVDLVPMLVPQASLEARARIIQEFRSAYDTSSYPGTRPMPGVQELLTKLWEKKIPTFVATSKVEKPSRRILESLGWTQFQDLVATDSISERLMNKAEILNQISKTWALDPIKTWMIGDTASDIVSAHANGFHGAAYAGGYGDPKELKESQPEVWLRRLDDFLPVLRSSNTCVSTC
jgi:phosphoglycolate phosphatase-like HAD superfamily hydrolase